MNSARWKNLSLKYQSIILSGGKNIGIRKSKFVTKIQILWLAHFYLEIVKIKNDDIFHIIDQIKVEQKRYVQAGVKSLFVLLKRGYRGYILGIGFNISLIVNNIFYTACTPLTVF